MDKLLRLVLRFRQIMENRILLGTVGLELSVNYIESSSSPIVVDHHILAIKVVLQGQEITGCIIVDGSGVNVISKTTCNRLDITDLEACPFWLRMAYTHSVRPLRFIWKLGIVVNWHNFEISTVLLGLDARGAYPILLGRPWLRYANIKQNWQHNCIGFRRV